MRDETSHRAMISGREAFLDANLSTIDIDISKHTSNLNLSMNVEDLVCFAIARWLKHEQFIECSFHFGVNE